MISLTSTTDTLQAFLSGAAATTNPTVLVEYHDLQVDEKLGTGEYPRGRDDTVLAGATETEILAAPAANVCRHVDSISLYNADTASVTATICIDANGTNRIILKATLGVGYTLHGEFYLGGRGWYVTDTTGANVTGSSQIEGTWTPTFTFATPGDLSVVYSTRVGYYLMDGGLVNYSWNIVTSTFTHTTASGNAQITGFPFTSRNITSIGNRGSLQWSGINKANYTEVIPNIAPNTALALLNASGMGQALANVTASDMATGGTVALAGSLVCYV